MRNAALRATIVALLLGAGHASAQQTTGDIVGRVVDEQGAAVPGATLTAKNPATGFVRSDVSDAAGLYRLSALPVGTYYWHVRALNVDGEPGKWSGARKIVITASP